MGKGKCFLYVLSRNDRHSGSRAVFDHNISDMDRSRNRNCTDFFHARKNLIFRNVILCLYGNHGDLAILYMNRGGHHTGRIGNFLLCIDFTTLTGISGYRDLLTFHRHSQRASQRTSDTDQFSLLHLIPPPYKSRFLLSPDTSADLLSLSRTNLQRTILGREARRVFSKNGLQPITCNESLSALMAAALGAAGHGLAFTYYSSRHYFRDAKFLSLGADGASVGLATALPPGRYHSKAALALQEVLLKVLSDD